MIVCFIKNPELILQCDCMLNRYLDEILVFDLNKTLFLIRMRCCDVSFGPRGAAAAKWLTSLSGN